MRAYKSVFVFFSFPLEYLMSHLYFNKRATHRQSIHIKTLTAATVTFTIIKMNNLQKIALEFISYSMCSLDIGGFI